MSRGQIRLIPRGRRVTIDANVRRMGSRTSIRNLLHSFFCRPNISAMLFVEAYNKSLPLPTCRKPRAISNHLRIQAMLTTDMKKRGYKKYANLRSAHVALMCTRLKQDLSHTGSGPYVTGSIRADPHLAPQCCSCRHMSHPVGCRHMLETLYTIQGIDSRGHMPRPLRARWARENSLGDVRS